MELGKMSRRSLEERAQEFQPARQAVLDHPRIDEVWINVGMPMEFDPRKGETPKPDGLEFTIPDEDDLSILRVISSVCDEHDLRVELPDYKQPNFSYVDRNGKRRVYHEDVGYEAFVRLVPDLE